MKYKVKIVLKLIFSLLIASAFFINAWAEGSKISTVTETPSRTVVKVGYYTSPVFQEGTGDGEIKNGYAYEYYQKLCEYTGWKYEYVYGGYCELYEKLVKGEIDLMAGLNWSEERAAEVSFPLNGMGTQDYNLLKKDSSIEVSADPASLDGKKIGVLNVDTMIQSLKYFCIGKNVNPEIVAYESFSEMMAAFRNDEVAAILVEGYANQSINKAHAFLTVGDVDFYLCCSRKRPDLLAQLNDAQNRLKNESPYYTSLLHEKYYPSSITSRIFSEEEINWLETHDTLRVGYLNFYLPYSDTDRDGNPNGIVKDITPLIFQSLGIETNISITYQGYDTYDEMIRSLNEGKLDAVFPVGGNLYYSELSGIYQSTKVLTAAMHLIYMEPPADKGKITIAINDRNSLQYYFVTTHFPMAKLLYCSSTEETLYAVMQGRADCTTLNGFRTSSILRNRKFNPLKRQLLTATDDRCFGILIGNDGLLKLINRGLSCISEKYAAEDCYQYTDQLFTYTFADFIHDYIVQLLCLAVIVILIIIFYIFLNDTKNKKYLKMEESKNRELQIARDQQENQIQEIYALNQNLESRMEIIQSMSNIYFAAYYIDLQANTFEELQGNDTLRKLIGSSGNAQDNLYLMCEYLIEKDTRNEMRQFVNLSTLNERLTDQTVITCEYKGVNVWWSQAYFIAGDRDQLGNLLHVFFATRTIHAEKQKEIEQNSKLEKALIEAEHANNAKTVFLNSMSHDIRTPMNAIIGFTNLAKNHLGEKELMEQYLDKISVSSNHLLLLINDVLDMSRIESGTVRISPQEVNVKNLSEEINTIVQGSVQEKKLTFETEMRNVEHKWFKADRLRLNQILLNITGNAIKFTPEGGKIRLSIEEKEGAEKGKCRYVFAVSDTGIGMSPEFQHHIFEPFTREQTSTVSGIQGTGLGMAITKNLVDLMKGNIEVESEEGKGTTFTVTLDFEICLHADESSASSEQKAEVKKQEESLEERKELFKGKHLLLAEDNVLNQEIACSVFEEMGFIVDVANDGNEAVDLVKNSEPGFYSIVIMDIQMPHKNGFEASLEIRHLKDSVNSAVPIVAMTANAFEEDRKKALEAGMNDHVSKPFDVEKLMSVVYTLIRQRNS